MRVDIDVDQVLLAKAQRITGVVDASQLLEQALHELIERESANRLARLGGSEPDAPLVPRRRGGEG